VNKPAASDTWVAAGVRVGLDYGSVRIGVAKSDATGLLASPYQSVTQQNSQHFDELGRLITDLDAVVVYVSEPISLKGEPTSTLTEVKAWLRELSVHLDQVPLRLLDERLTSSVAKSQMRSKGEQPSRQKSLVDANAAAVLLQGALDFERIHQRWAGHPFS
jgi:putative Holliday junction resolvase